MIMSIHKIDRYRERKRERTLELIHFPRTTKFVVVGIVSAIEDSERT